MSYRSLPQEEAIQAAYDFARNFYEENGYFPHAKHWHVSMHGAPIGADRLYKIFGSKNVHLWHGRDDEDIWHWWCVDKDGEIIDLTADQYYNTNRTPLYDNGKKAGLLGWGYRKKVEKMLTKVLDNYDQT